MLHHLFPLMQVKVGSPEAPCEYLLDGISEIDMYRDYIQNMPKEGVLITDERVEVDVKGVAGQGADYTTVLEHYKKRIFTGLGVSGLDLGETDTANRNTADNVSQNLRDQIKSDLQWFCNQVSMTMLKEWFMEAPFACSVQNAVADVTLEFHELDPDGQIKNETHAINLYNNHAITHPELRKRLKHKPLSEEEHGETHFQRHEMELERFRAQQQMKTTAMSATATETKKVTQKGARGASKTTQHTKPTAHAQKLVQQILQPVNQHGRNLDPHKAKSSRELVAALYDELHVHLANGQGETWGEISAWTVDSVLEGYSKELQARVKAFVRNADDEDILYASLSAALLQDGTDDEPCMDEPQESADIEEGDENEIAAPEDSPTPES
jgi:hypothetical protein